MVDSELVPHQFIVSTAEKTRGQSGAGNVLAEPLMGGGTIVGLFRLPLAYNLSVFVPCPEYDGRLGQRLRGRSEHAQRRILLNCIYPWGSFSYKAAA
ncbi:hypothetical protein EVAR_86222_1 [Eumeta japonica]|uniref:Uncharacterized protein n=1 Tax=Eumeta variegata TaxID=151549 RepID=A0A4C1UBL4_EUMVA|nr:hypothetical protein EVAR_86222_1 [Eumeta japonica]